MLDHVAVPNSPGDRTRTLIAESSAWRAWAARMQADMQRTIGTSERMLRDGRRGSIEKDRFGLPRAPEQ